MRKSTFARRPRSIVSSIFVVISCDRSRSILPADSQSAPEDTFIAGIRNAHVHATWVGLTVPGPEYRTTCVEHTIVATSRPEPAFGTSSGEPEPKLAVWHRSAGVDQQGRPRRPDRGCADITLESLEPTGSNSGCWSMAALPATQWSRGINASQQPRAGGHVQEAPQRAGGRQRVRRGFETARRWLDRGGRLTQTEGSAELESGELDVRRSPSDTRRARASRPSGPPSE